MDNEKAIQILEYMKNFDDCSYGAPKIAIDKAIKSIHFESRAKTLLQAAVELLNQQNDSSCVLNMLTQTVFYDEAECDGLCLIEDIKALLADN